MLKCIDDNYDDDNYDDDTIKSMRKVRNKRKSRNFVKRNFFNFIF